MEVKVNVMAKKKNFIAFVCVLVLFAAGLITYIASENVWTDSTTSAKSTTIPETTSEPTTFTQEEGDYLVTYQSDVGGGSVTQIGRERIYK